MTEENSSDGSEYYDFTPSKQIYTEEEDESLDWDEDTEQLSFIENNEIEETVRNSTPGPDATQPTHPRVVGDYQTFPFVWPPRRLSSEFNNQQIVSLVPRGGQENEEPEHYFDEDNVFDDQEKLTIEEMGPKVKSPEEIHQIFTANFRDWKRNVGQVNEMSESLLQDYIEDFKALKDLAKSLSTAAGDEYEEQYPDVKNSMKTVRQDVVRLENLIGNKNEPNNRHNAVPAKPPESNEDLDTIVTTLSVSFDVTKQTLTQIRRELTDAFNDVPAERVEVTEKRTLAVRDLLDQAEAARKKTTSTQLEISQVAVRYSTEEKKNQALNTVANQMTAVRGAAETIKNIGFTYLSRAKAPAPTAAAQVVQQTRSTLQRVPLPKFSGKTTDYLHFKTVFTTQATYDNEIDKVMALMDSLTKQSDKNKISKELTLAACFEKLDGEYGDLTTLASECTSIIDNLQPPKSDKTFVSFMDTVEECISSLKAVQLGENYVPTLMLSVEKKPSKPSSKDVSLAYVSD